MSIQFPGSPVPGSPCTKSNGGPQTSELFTIPLSPSPQSRPGAVPGAMIEMKDMNAVKESPLKTAVFELATELEQFQPSISAINHHPIARFFGVHNPAIKAFDEVMSSLHHLKDHIDSSDGDTQTRELINQLTDKTKALSETSSQDDVFRSLFALVHDRLKALQLKPLPTPSLPG
jgi:hypothetical protein